jgi:hypothetical protein
MVFLVINVAWMYFAQASLQHAVQAGVRFAVTGTVMQGYTGQDASIKSIVQQQAMGFLSGPDGLDKITINYYSPTSLGTVLTGAGSNAGGNIIEVKVQGVTMSVLGPLLNGGPLALALSAISTDVMESSPGGIPPKR